MYAAIDSMSRRKARQYEREFLTRIRDMIDKKIKAQDEFGNYYAECVAERVKQEFKK